MRIVDAIWEKDNLGVETAEIICTGEENQEELYGALSSINKPYQVLRIPSGSINLLLAAQDAGFRMIEGLLCMDIRTGNLVLPAYGERFLKDSILRVADDKELDLILSTVRDGEVFETDRISLDPYFSASIAGRRYYNWIKKMLEDGEQINVVEYKGELVTFGICKEIRKGEYDAVIGGSLCKDRIGVGFLGIYANTMLASPGSKVITRVSTNNLSIIKLHVIMGYEVRDLTYVLIKHVV